VTSFDPFGHIEITDEGSFITGEMCNKDGRFGVTAYGVEMISCCGHLVKLLDEADTQWAGDLVAVRVLRTEQANPIRFVKRPARKR
jgi:hypothetical protein